MEAAVTRCQSCGAPISENDAQCPYCHSQVATVACPRCFGTVSIHAKHCSHCGAAVEVREQGTESILDCPECKLRLLVTPVGGVDIHLCPRCTGIWLEHKRFQNLSTNAEQRGQIMGAAGVGPSQATVQHEVIRYRPCPVCKQLMNRFNFGHSSGVILDSCKPHGLWFDREELRRVLNFIDGGGLVRAKEKQEAEARQQEAMVRFNAQMHLSERMESENHSSFDSFDDVVNTVQGLFHLVKNLRS